MRKSKVLTKLRSGDFARVCGLGHFLPFFISHASHRKYDGIWLDLEHRTMNAREVQAILAYCHLNNIDCMVRPPSQHHTDLYRYLEEGAAGMMFPFVNNPETAKKLVDAAKYPPLGNRGVDGAGLDGNYSLEAWAPGSTYFQDANRETFLVAQIETLEGLENAEAIGAIEGIDVLFVGPADLGRRLGGSSLGSAVTLEQAIQRVAQAAKKSNKAWGITASSLDKIAHYRKMGAQLVPWGGDFYLTGILEKCSQELDQILETK